MRPGRGLVGGLVGGVALVLLLPLVGCTGSSQEEAAPPAVASATTPTDSPAPTASPTPTDSDSGTPSDTPSNPPSATTEPSPTTSLPPVRNRISLPALMRERIRSGTITRTRPLAETERWRSWAVSYPVGDRKVSGELLVPRGDGPFPAVVLTHGYIDPAVYALGQGMSREQEYLADAGFVVLHTDYAGHAESDPVGDLDRESRLAYTRDAIAAVKALRREPVVDPGRLAMFGRSMGGGVTYNALVTAPGLVDAAVVWAPVSSRFLDNLRQFTVPNRPEAVAELYRRFGTPAESPGVYADLSPRWFLDRVTEPVLILHGDSDDTCPLQWSRETVTAMTRAGVDAELTVYAGEEHAFGPRFTEGMQQTVDFLRRRLGP